MQWTDGEQLIEVCAFAGGSDLIRVCDLEKNWLSTEDSTELPRRPEESSTLEGGEVIKCWGRGESLNGSHVYMI